MIERAYLVHFKDAPSITITGTSYNTYHGVLTIQNVIPNGTVTRGVFRKRKEQAWLYTDVASYAAGSWESIEAVAAK